MLYGRCDDPMSLPLITLSFYMSGFQDHYDAWLASLFIILLTVQRKLHDILSHLRESRPHAQTIRAHRGAMWECLGVISVGCQLLMPMEGQCHGLFIAS